MKRDLGFTFTIIVSMATFVIALVVGFFLIWETGSSAVAQELRASHTQLALNAGQDLTPANAIPAQSNRSAFAQ